MAAKKKLTSEQKITVAKCVADPIYFITTQCYIQTTEHGLVPFALFDYQKDLIRDFISHRNNIILKSRQLGISTLTAAYSLWVIMFHSYKLIGVAATSEYTAQNLMNMVKVAYDNLPAWLQEACPKVSDNQQELELVNGSKIICSATTKNTFRGRALSLLIVDEAAHIDLIDSLWASTKPALSTGGHCIMLSSPLGVGNFFHQMWVKAESGTNNFKPTKLMWSVRYDMAWFQESSKDMSPEQIAQEFECSFSGSGSTVIRGRDLESLAAGISEPGRRTGNENELWVWKEPHPRHKYLLVADVARTTSGDSDFSAFHVFDLNEMEQVAEFYHRIPLEDYAQYIYDIATKMYPNPLVVIEGNTIGDVVVADLERARYRNLYYSRRGDILAEDGHRNVMWADPDELMRGFVMTQDSRIAVIRRMEIYLRLNKLKIYSKRLMHELQHFVWKNNKPQALKGQHDDLVMPLAIACWVIDTVYGGGMASGANQSQRTDLTRRTQVYAQKSILLDDTIVEVKDLSERAALLEHRQRLMRDYVVDVPPWMLADGEGPVRRQPAQEKPKRPRKAFVVRG